MSMQTKLATIIVNDLIHLIPKFSQAFEPILLHDCSVRHGTSAGSKSRNVRFFDTHVRFISILPYFHAFGIIHISLCPPDAWQKGKSTAVAKVTMHKYIIDSYSASRNIETAKCLWVQQPKPGRVCNQDPLQPQWASNIYKPTNPQAFHMLFDGKQVKIQFCHWILQKHSPSSHGTYIITMYITAVAAWMLRSSWLPQRCHCERSHQRVSFSELDQCHKAKSCDDIGFHSHPFVLLDHVMVEVYDHSWLISNVCTCLYPNLTVNSIKQSITVACSKDRCFRWGRSWSWNAFLLALSWWKGPSVVKSGVRYESFSNPGQDSIS